MVIVETDTIYLSEKPPSIRVIVTMWERDGRERSQEGAPTIQVRIHWFLRLTEMASIRVKSNHEEASNSIYCILITNTCFIDPNLPFPATVVLVPSIILSQSLVSLS